MVETPGPGSIPSTPTPGGAAAMLAPGTPGVPPAPQTPAPPTPPAPGAPSTPPASTAPWKDGEVWKIGDKEWWESIPEADVRETMKAKQYANPAVTAVAYSNLLKLQNGNPDIIVAPGKDATPEQVQAFDKTLRTKLGVPETADKYDLKLGDNPDPKFVDFGKTALHKMGVPPAKAQEFVDGWNKFVGEQKAELLATQTKANDDAVTALETKWGPELKANLAAGNAAMKALGVSADLVEKIEGQIGTAPIVELLATLGKKIGEAGFGPGTGASGQETPETMTKEAATAKIAALNTDTEFQTKYTTKGHPEHENAVNFMLRLMERAGRPT